MKVRVTLMAENDKATCKPAKVVSNNTLANMIQTRLVRAFREMGKAATDGARGEKGIDLV